MVSHEEESIYNTLGIPLPTLSPEERARNRLAWRNERRLYRRSCSATGRSIVSIHHQDAPFPVYAQDYWWSDGWDFKNYGKEFDFTRSFFQQFIELYRAVPQIALNSPYSENSEYTNQCIELKNCYLCFCSGLSRDCMYGMWNSECTECLDCTYLEKSELCYQVLNGKRCYRAIHCENISQSNECYFCRDMIGCSECIGCVGLRQKKQCVFNKQLDKAGFEAFLKEARLDTQSGLSQMQKRFKEFESKLPRKFYSGSHNESFSGDYLENNRNCYNSYNSRESDHSWHARDAWESHYSIDLLETFGQEYCVHLEGCYKNSYSAFSAKINHSGNVWYSSHIYNSSDIFACVGVKNSKFCIFNREYKESEYKKLREKIITHMKNSGEWGEYFPIQASPFAYNDSVAQEYFPLTKEEAISFGYYWRDEPRNATINGEATPESLASADGDVLNKTFLCSESARAYKINRLELDFHLKIGVALPCLHPDTRFYYRMANRNPRSLNHRECAKCQLELQTTFPASSKYQILCQACYGSFE
jgi:hypothetical protein